MKNKQKEFGLHQAIDVRIDALKKYKFKLNTDVFIKTGITGFEFNTEHFQIEKSGFLIVHEGYSWDGASGAIDNAEFLLASMIHDVLYQALRLGLLPAKYRKQADDLLANIGVANGMPKFRAWYSRAAVRLLGWRFTKPSKGMTHHD